ncbi:hypothetical protein LTR99_011018 [Exophiala xenobiotica]|uniref:Uncharacterized protein n=1 Tax=Vermiconidia calcicola TaxID=1690605 RepID=A0AAV9PQZ9_9PEZI|nr:hypothetical protein LTR99_011018 [Exophiala xenobiotica]KAK5425569.1 hypothetical protein LTR34_010993 [Exophiala xenobiotica]KAK5527699.1 hypothetical protein LTR25_010977 [Vermiconidia calcicola]KAK5528184.1 hypothetical protein LTR23_011091 [Chaetothyriales sp. CCFEE 6169]
MMYYFTAENPMLHIVNVQPGSVNTRMTEIAKFKGNDAAELAGHFCVWLVSPEAKFLKSKYVWANWDVDEMIARAEEIQNSTLLTWSVEGVQMEAASIVYSKLSQSIR